jgi:hypothetical protein
MLTCNGCRVAKFCSADHQKMASKKTSFGWNLRTGLHKDICGVFGKWSQVVKDGVASDSCIAELLACLQRKNSHHLPTSMYVSDDKWILFTEQQRANS